MKISDQEPIRFLESYLLGVKGKQEASSAKQSQPIQPVSSDNVEISTRAKNYQQANRFIASVPDTRSDRIAQIQAKIEKGTELFQSAQVAEKLVRSTLLDAIL